MASAISRIAEEQHLKHDSREPNEKFRDAVCVQNISLEIGVWPSAAFRWAPWNPTSSRTGCSRSAYPEKEGTELRIGSVSVVRVLVSLFQSRCQICLS